MNTSAVGVDIIEIERIERALAKFGPRFLRRVYTQLEAAFCRGRSSELAARFAAKEAVMKALGTGARGVAWREIEVLPNHRGKPLIDRYVEMLPGPSERTYSLAEAPEIAGLDLDVARVMWKNAGLASQQGEEVRDEDIDAMRAFKTYSDAGFPLEALAEGSRVFA